MILYRIAHSLYKDDLSGEGAALYGARWNSKGTRMLYTSEHISLCALEMLVHVPLSITGASFFLLHIQVPDELSPAEIRVDKLKERWQEDEPYTAFMGDQFAAARQSLYLKVPSAVIPEENNFLINPRHPSFKKVKIIRSAPFTFDKRLAAFT